MKRRDFIRLGAGSLALAAVERVMGAGAPSNRVRLAVVGCHEKGRGYQLLMRAAETPGLEVAVVCDVDARARTAGVAKVREIAGNVPDAVTDFRTLLTRNDLDGFVIATPDHWHAWMGIAAMRAGKAVYLEKPCTASPSEGDVLIRVQRETQGIFLMGSQRRSGKSYIAAVKAIHDGAIGRAKFARAWYQNDRKPIGRGKCVPVPDWLDWELWQGPAPREAYRDNIVHYNWHWFRKWGTGECANNATHFLDIARWAMQLDYPVRTVSAAANGYKRDCDWEWFDMQSASWEFPNDRLIVWEGHSSIVYPPPFNSWTGCHILGDGGSVVLGPTDCTQYDLEGRVVRTWQAADASAGDGALSTTNPTEAIDRDHLAEFARCIRAHDVHTDQDVVSSVKSSLLPHLANIAQLTGESVRTDPVTGRLLAGSPGAEHWTRAYEPGWDITRL